MKPFFVFLFYLCFIFVLNAQNNTFDVKGSISDSQTGEPIENVNIIVSGENYGSTSGPLGEYKMTISKLPFTLEFSHISYENASIKYEHIPLQHTSVKLSPKTEQLSQITVTSERIDIIYEDEEYSVLDYELTEDGILLLIFKNRLTRAELLYINYAGEALSKLRVLPLKPLMLYKDCMGETNILSKDYVRQIYFGNDKIELYKPVKIEHYKRIMGDCKFKLHNKIYFSLNSYYDLIKDYYYIDTLDNSRHNIASAYEHTKLNFLLNNPENLLYANGLGGPADLDNLQGLPGDSSILNSIRESNVTLRFNKMAYYSEIYAPIFHMGDSICIFNHPLNKIQFYDIHDSLISQTEIAYHITEKRTEMGTFFHAFAKPAKWLKEIYVNEKQHKAYTLFQNLSGTYDLKEINLNTGKVSYVLTIPYPFVQKLKIKNGALFFVYKDWGLNPQKKLYRQRID